MFFFRMLCLSYGLCIFKKTSLHFVGSLAVQRDGFRDCTTSLVNGLLIFVLCSEVLFTILFLSQLWCQFWFQISDLRLYQPRPKRSKTKQGKRAKKKRQASESDLEHNHSESGISSDLESLLSRADSELSYFTSDGDISGLDSSSSASEMDNAFELQRKKQLISSAVSKTEVGTKLVFF